MSDNTTKIPPKPNSRGLKPGTEEFKARSREIRNWRLIYESGFNERTKLYTKAYTINNRDRIKEINNRPENRARSNNLQRARRIKNYKKHRTYHKAYFKKRYTTDPFFKINHVLRVALRDSIRDGYSVSSISQCLGCNVNELKIHLEQQFYLGMNWNNYGKIWHIDHIIPLALGIKLGLSVDSVWNYINLQPLPVAINLSKHHHLYKCYLKKILAHPDSPSELVDIALAVLSY